MVNTVWLKSGKHVYLEDFYSKGLSFIYYDWWIQIIKTSEKNLSCHKFFCYHKQYESGWCYEISRTVCYSGSIWHNPYQGCVTSPDHLFFYWCHFPAKSDCLCPQRNNPALLCYVLLRVNYSLGNWLNNTIVNLFLSLQSRSRRSNVK